MYKLHDSIFSGINVECFCGLDQKYKILYLLILVIYSIEHYILCRPCTISGSVWVQQSLYYYSMFKCLSMHGVCAIESSSYVHM